MAMDKTDQDDNLQAFFDAAREQPAPTSEALLARVLKDALSVQDATETVRSEVPKVGLLAGLWAALGGWPAMTGLATATVAGLWIGVSPSLGLSDAVTTALGANGVESYIDEFATGFDYAFEEGETG